jgi:hypothetical protein
MWHPIRAFKYRDIGRLDYNRFNVLIRCVSLPLCGIVGLDHNRFFLPVLIIRSACQEELFKWRGRGGGAAPPERTRKDHDTAPTNIKIL